MSITLCFELVSNKQALKQGPEAEHFKSIGMKFCPKKTERSYWLLLLINFLILNETCFYQFKAIKANKNENILE